MGPLALMAKEAGFEVCGSDLERGAIYGELVSAGIEVVVGRQDGGYLAEKLAEGVDWFVYTSALPDDHPELVMAREAGIKCTKRDDLTEFLIRELGLKLVAVAGTHGKTTTAAMIVWASLQLGLPVAYIVGTTLGFAPSGAYKKGDKYFVYEADEYDRNFLKFHPWLAVIPFVSYDHPDIYPTREDYEEAFLQFRAQCDKVIENAENDYEIRLAGEVRRIDAGLAVKAILQMAPEIEIEKVVEVLNRFPGVGRRFEKLTDGVYTDYAHHPEEITATVEVAKEEAEMTGKKGVVVVYQPHQNTRQHEVRGEYRDAFSGVEKIYWLPTYLTRENPDLAVLTPEELIKGLSNSEVAEAVEFGDELAEKLRKDVEDDYLVILMTAGPADGWLRDRFGG